jgi:hypothetical protein
MRGVEERNAPNVVLRRMEKGRDPRLIAVSGYDFLLLLSAQFDRRETDGRRRNSP